MAVEAHAPLDHRGRIIRAVGWMIGAIVSFTAMAVAGRAAARHADILQVSVWRTFFGFAILLVIVRLQGIQIGSLASMRPDLQVVRNLIHFTAQFCWLMALTRMTLAELTTLEFTAPLWVALLAPLLLGERLTALRIGAAVLGFVGVLVVVRPGVMAIGAGTPFALTAALGYALSMITTKRLLRSDSALTILFWMQGLQVLIGFSILVASALIGYGPGLAVPSAIALTWIGAIGVLGLAAHYSLAKAFTYGDTIIVAPMDFLRLPLVALVGMALYAEAFDFWVVGGGLIVVLANLLNIRGERASAR
jgi:drug/metabolite transporter (DMT)-like permease